MLDGSNKSKSVLVDGSGSDGSDVRSTCKRYRIHHKTIFNEIIILSVPGVHCKKTSASPVSCGVLQRSVIWYGTGTTLVIQNNFAWTKTGIVQYFYCANVDIMRKKSLPNPQHVEFE